MPKKTSRTKVSLHREFSHAGYSVNIVVYPDMQPKFHAWAADYGAKWDILQSTAQQAINDLQPFTVSGVHSVMVEFKTPYIVMHFFGTAQGKSFCLGPVKCLISCLLPARVKSQFLAQGETAVNKIALQLGKEWQLPLWQTNVSPPSLVTHEGEGDGGSNP